MKTTLTLSFLALLVTTALEAQWTTDVQQNTAVRTVLAGEAASHLVADGPDGSTYDSWFENGSGEYQLRMQRLDADGNRLWPDSGLVVSDHPQNSAIFRYDLNTDADGNAIVAFQDERTGTLDVVAYKIAPDGSFLWGTDGIELPTPGTTGIAPVVAALSNGNTAIAWSTTDSPGKVAVQIVGPTGIAMLNGPLEITAATRVDRPQLLATADGGFILQYVVSNGGFGIPPGKMYAQRYDANAQAVWSAPVQVSSKDIAFFFFPQPVPDGHDGFYLAYNTGNPDNPSFTDVFVQHLRSNGTLWSTDGTRADDGSTTQKFTAGKGLALVSDNDGLMVPLQVTDGAQGQSGIAVQRLDTAGTRLLGNMAVNVVPVSASYVQPDDISATVDGAVIIQTSGVFGQQHLAATRVNLSGIAIWNPAQMDLCTVNSNKEDVQSTSMRSGQVVVVWQDDRSPAGIYAQNITGLDVGSGVASISPGPRQARLEQNPAPAPVLLLPPTIHERQLTVYGPGGKCVYSESIPGTVTRKALPLAGLPAGAYVIRVVAGSDVDALRWVK